MRISASQLGSGFSRHFGTRRSWVAQSVAAVSLRHRDREWSLRSSGRHARYLRLRAQHRLRNALWAIFAAATLFIAWGISCRLDEATYTDVGNNVGDDAGLRQIGGFEFSLLEIKKPTGSFASRLSSFQAARC
jgi:hypothetical protein